LRFTLDKKEDDEIKKPKIGERGSFAFSLYIKVSPVRDNAMIYTYVLQSQKD